jgi:hypothetical protein
VIFWSLLLLSLPVGLLLGVLFPVPFFGEWERLPWISGIVLYYVLHQRQGPAFLAAMLGAIMLDGFSIAQPGSSVLLFGFAWYIADRYRSQIVPDAVITAAVFGAATGLCGMLMGFLILYMDGNTAFRVWRFAGRLVFQVMAGGVLTPLTCLLMQWLHRALGLVAGEELHRVEA